MRRSTRIKAISLVLAMTCVIALGVLGSGMTGAYFSDTNNGALAGTVGSIQVTTSGGSGADALNFAWENMLPGEVYEQTANFQNTGRNTQDIWLVFPNKTALSTLNSLGTYGAVKITSSDGAYFYSNNLNDHPADQAALDAVPQMVKLASNVTPTASGWMKFEFQYASKMRTQEPAWVFNMYPVVTPGTPASAGWPNDGNQAGYGQNFVDPADGSGTGLPFQIVATQPGIAPGAPGTSAGF